jgi:hypothetical protein
MATLALLSPTEAVSLAKDLVPQLGRIKLPTGSVISVAALATQTMHDYARRRIQGAAKVKTKKEDEDNKRVLKLNDAIDCVEETFTPEKVWTIFNRMLEVIVSGEQLDLDLANPIIQCFRANLLRQDSKRKRLTYRYAKREI